MNTQQKISTLQKHKSKKYLCWTLVVDMEVGKAQKNKYMLSRDFGSRIKHQLQQGLSLKRAQRIKL